MNQFQQNVGESCILAFEVTNRWQHLMVSNGLVIKQCNVRVCVSVENVGDMRVSLFEVSK